MTLTMGTQSSTDANQNVETEIGVRRALGLGGANSSPDHRLQAHRSTERYSPDDQKRRFARASEVPVVVVNGRSGHGSVAAKTHGEMNSVPANRLEIAESALRAEREARARADHALNEAQTVIHDLRTKLGHAVLAQDEAREAAQQAAAERQKVEAALVVEQNARQKVEARLQEALDERDAAEQQLRDLNAASRKAVVAVKKSSAVSRTPTSPTIQAEAPRKAPRAKPAVPEPKPVKWWLPKKKG
jgi:hypothetical protein